MAANVTAATTVNIFKYNDWFQLSGILSNQNITFCEKLCVNTDRVTSTPQVPSVTREEHESVVASLIRESWVVNIKKVTHIILDGTTKYFPKINATGRSYMFMFRPRCEVQDPTNYCKECIVTFTNYIVDEVRG